MNISMIHNQNWSLFNP